MNVTPDPDQPEDVLAYLADGVRAVRDALDEGISFADGILSALPLDPYLWAHLVRYQARAVLTGLEPETWSLGRDLRNSGIEIARGPFTVRALKSQGGGPPHPGGSGARRSFWGQQMALPFDGNEGAVGANLILDWDAGLDREILLGLSKPIGIWKYRGIPKLEWRRPVEVGEDTELRFTPGEEDVDVEPRFDLTELEEEGDAG